MIIWKEFTFDAAHFLPNVPDGHKCKRMHGHTFRLRVELYGTPLRSLGWVADFSSITAAVSPILKKIDHAVLNDFHGLDNPTSENIAVWFWEQLESQLKLWAIEVSETSNSGVRYTGP